MALLLDGTTFGEAMVVIALGIAISGEKHCLGFVQTGEHDRADAV